MAMEEVKLALSNWCRMVRFLDLDSENAGLVELLRFELLRRHGEVPLTQQCPRHAQ